ncbi:protein WEAK CHLOROPLAST MOVEMENT UNDER BLUE LIGHT 1-like [Zingiber officinale]|uniref:protein WEAK CHLOROPLAST MOVEMENT UNDER BLUE LIGHT 1-like n=1 Tax=Zingiber officinale TaxID=94328 RepID=UPI001C4D22EA|nr:protein WEAK CHLOROPLAST MOVEMENT UNDER BLUE LIGHT 1-like [Zingiber officinale]
MEEASTLSMPPESLPSSEELVTSSVADKYLESTDHFQEKSVDDTGTKVEQHYSVPSMDNKYVSDRQHKKGVEEVYSNYKQEVAVEDSQPFVLQNFEYISSEQITFTTDRQHKKGVEEEMASVELQQHLSGPSSVDSKPLSGGVELTNKQEDEASAQLQQHLSDPSSENNKPLSEQVNANNKQEVAVQDSEPSVQQNFAYISAEQVTASESLTTHRQLKEGAEDEDEASAQLQQHFSDSSSVHSKPFNEDVVQIQKFVDISSPQVTATLNVDTRSQHQKGDGSQQSIANASIIDIDNANANAKDNSSVLDTSVGGKALLISETIKDPLSHFLEAQKGLKSISPHKGKASSKYGTSEDTKRRKSERKPSRFLSDLSRWNALGETDKKPAELTKSFKNREVTNRGIVDTSTQAPVMAVVNKFGGTYDWRANKAQFAKQKTAKFELEKVQGEIAKCKRQLDFSEEAKVQVLKEMEGTERLIEELKHKLERAKQDEAHARQDMELSHLRFDEIEQGIPIESSNVVKAQLEVARERHEAIMTERQSSVKELKDLQEKLVLLITERDTAIRKSKEATFAAMEIEKKVEELTMELNSTKGPLQSARAAYLEANEHRIGAILVRDQDCLTWEKELKQVEEEVQQFYQLLTLTKDLKLKLDTSSALLSKVKAELVAYMKAKLEEESEGLKIDKMSDNEAETKRRLPFTEETDLTKRELEELNNRKKESENVVNSLRVAFSDLKSELEAEKSALNILKQREGMASIVVSSLVAEIDRTNKEIEAVRMREKEGRDKMVELLKSLPRAAQEADEAKSVAKMVREELQNSRNEAEQAQAAASTMQMKLHATFKEIEAAKASEKLALAQVHARQDSVHLPSGVGVTLQLDEYLTLCKKANEAEQLAREKMTAAHTEIEMAIQSHLLSLKRLKEAYREMPQRKEALEIAMKKAEEAMSGKLAAEQAFRACRAELEHQRKANDAGKATVGHQASSLASVHQRSETNMTRKPEEELEQQWKASNEATSVAVVGPEESTHSSLPHESETTSSKKQESDVLVHPELEDTKHSIIVNKKKKSVFWKFIFFFGRRTKH